MILRTEPSLRQGSCWNVLCHVVGWCGGESLRRSYLVNIGWSFGLSMYSINIMETSKRRRSVRLLTIHRVQPQLDPFLPFHYRNSASRECLFSIFRSHRHSSRPPQFHCHDGRLLWPDCTLSFIALHDANQPAGDPVDSDPLWFHCSAYSTQGPNA